MKLKVKVKVTTDVDCQSVFQRVNNDDVKASTRITRRTHRHRMHQCINLIATMAIKKALLGSVISRILTQQ
jgi:hypothetical protein